jgi:hypothetical protein
MVVDIEPHVKARVAKLIAQVGEGEFRRGVAQMTRWDTEIRSLEDVICLYVMARRGRVAPPELGHRAVAVHETLPGRTADDAGFRDRQGRRRCTYSSGVIPSVACPGPSTGWSTTEPRTSTCW